MRDLIILRSTGDDGVTLMRPDASASGEHQPTVMPKLLVLYAGAERSSALADAVARGARGVRFTEVELRRTAGGPDKERPEPAAAKSRGLDAYETLTDYDALVLVGDESGAAALTALADGEGPLTDVVGTVVAAEGIPRQTTESLAAALGRRGMILISGSDDPESVGRRAAKVGGWVRHAKGHEHGHTHGHSHGHPHPHPHSHD
jgi:hypothetical protein